MSCHMTKYLFFTWLQIEISCVVEGINSESAKVQNELVLKMIQKFIMLQTFQKVHINDKPIKC